MNKVELMGRLTRNPEMRYSSGENQTAIARYTLAVDRRRRNGEENAADFINCVVFGRGAEFAEKYLHKGTKLVVIGRIQTGSFTRQDGTKAYTTEVVVEEQEFAESKSSSQAVPEDSSAQAPAPAPETENGDFMSIPEGLDDDLPFN